MEFTRVLRIVCVICICLWMLNAPLFCLRAEAVGCQDTMTTSNYFLPLQGRNYQQMTQLIDEYVAKVHRGIGLN